MSFLKKIKHVVGDSHFRVLRGMAFVTVFMLFSRLIAAGKEMAIAYRFGVDAVVDVYVFAFVLVAWIPSMAQSIFQSVLVPLLNKYEGLDRAEFVGQLTAVFLLVGLTVTIFVMFFLPVLIPFLAGSMPAAATQQLIFTVQAMAPCVLLMFAVALFSAELLSREKHANTLLEAVTPLTLLVFILYWSIDGDQITPLLLGTLIGTAVHAVILFFLSNRSGSIARIKLSFAHRGWTSFWKAISVLLFGTVVLSVVRPFDQYLAANLGEGAISSLSYATRLLALGLALGTTVLSRALLPVLSDKKQTTESRKNIAVRWSYIVFVGGVIVGVIAWFVVPWAVQLLFERGAFTKTDTLKVSTIVRAGLLQMPFMLSGLVLVQLFASLGDYRRIAFSGFIGVAVKVGSGFWLAQQYGVAGIAMATGLMYAATFAFFLWSVKFQINQNPV